MSATLSHLSRRAATAVGRRNLRPRTCSGPAQCSRVSSAMAAAAARSDPQHLHLMRPAQAFDLAGVLATSGDDGDDVAVVAASASSQRRHPAATTTSTGTADALPVFQRSTSVMDVVSDMRVLKAVAQVKLFGLPSQVKGTLPVDYRASEAESAAAAAAAPGDLEFCCESLDRVSRSFAAVIRQLPESLAVPTCAFYLVLRALDTVEDEMDFAKFSAASARVLTGSAAAATVASDPLLFKTSCLLSFHRLVAAESDADADAAWATLEALNAADVGEGNDQELLQSFDKVARVLREHCTPAQREIVADITAQMATGMAEYVQRDLGVDGTVDRADYNRYCHIVAGLVGEGLSRLWATAEDSGLPARSLSAVTAETGLGSLSSDMGLFLQKANIIRDYAEDQADGRAFWPADVWAAFSPTGRLGAFRATQHARGAGLACLNSMVNDALALAPSCFEYLEHLAPGDSRILRFCAIPQVMALCTLAECYANPAVFHGVVKTPKTQSARICCEVGDMTGVLAWYGDMCSDIEAKAAAWERADAFDAARDAPVVAATRAGVGELRAVVRRFQRRQRWAAQHQDGDDDDDEIPDNWPCGPHIATAQQQHSGDVDDNVYMQDLLEAAR